MVSVKLRYLAAAESTRELDLCTLKYQFNICSAFSPMKYLRSHKIRHYSRYDQITPHLVLLAPPGAGLVPPEIKFKRLFLTS